MRRWDHDFAEKEKNAPKLRKLGQPYRVYRTSGIHKTGLNWNLIKILRKSLSPSLAASEAKVKALREVQRRRLRTNPKPASVVWELV